MRTAALVLALSLAAGSALAAPVPRPPGQAAKPASPTVPLAGDTPDEVRAWLGEPAVASGEGKGALWTYRLDDCALMVFFKDQGSGLKVTGVATGPRRRADVAPDAESCIASAKRGGG
jgi:hypothetical protein